MGSGGIRVHVRYECGICDATAEAWIPLYEKQAGSAKLRPNGWIHTREKGMVCPDCWEMHDLRRVPRGL